MTAEQKTTREHLRRLYIGDNLPVLRGLEDESADLIYLDPPFNSKRMYEGNLDPEMGRQSFADIWTMSDINKDDLWALRAFVAPKAHDLIMTLAETHGESYQAYLTFMAIRLDEMRRILKPTGSVYLHCDWRMNAPLRLLMDILFGADNLRNEIIWCYPPKGQGPKFGFHRKHDVLLFYGMRADAGSFNRPHTSLDSYQKGKFSRRESGRQYKEFKGVRTYLDKSKGRPVPSWWADIAPAGQSRKEMTGWATQKPLALLDRIIKASSNEGDVVLDPFCGCATACVAAERLGRQWIGIDQHPAVGGIMEKRIKDDTKLAPEWEGVEIVDARKARNLPRRKGVREIEKNDAAKRELYDAQGGKCAAKQWCMTGGDVRPEFMHFDRIDPGKRGGYYTRDNVQLLCSKCNAVKSGKTWTQFINERKRDAMRKIAEDPDIPR